MPFLQYREGDLASKLPRLLILVTGKGPQKGMYLEMMRALDLRRVAFRTLWLDPEDYPLLLGSCDAGVSLHTSSSGLDLPMKVRKTMSLEGNELQDAPHPFNRKILTSEK